MGLIQSDVGRLFFFILITAAEVLLGIFLIFHGSDNLKIFAIFILIVQLFSMNKIYFYFSNFRQLI